MNRGGDEESSWWSFVGVKEDLMEEGFMVVLWTTNAETDEGWTEERFEGGFMVKEGVVGETVLLLCASFSGNGGLW